MPFGYPAQLINGTNADSLHTHQRFDARIAGHVKMIADMQPGEIASTVSPSDSTGTGRGDYGWTTGSRITLTPTYSSPAPLPGRLQSVAFTSDATTNAQAASLVFPAAVTVKSCIDFWVYVTDSDLDTMNYCYLHLYETAEGSSYRRFVFNKANLQKLGVLPNTWCRLHLPWSQLANTGNNSSAADYPQPWGWTDTQVDGNATYDEGTELTTIVTHTAVWDADLHTGKAIIENGQTDRFVINSVEDANTITVAGDETATFTDTTFIKCLVPVAAWSFEKIQVTLKSTGNAFSIYIGQISSPESDRAIFIPGIDEPYACGVTVMDELLTQYRWRGKGDINAAGYTIGAEDYHTWAELIAYEALGYCLKSHSAEHIRTEPITGTCDTDGTTVTATDTTWYVGSETGGNGSERSKMMIGTTIYTVASITSTTELELTATAGAQEDVAFTMYSDEASHYFHHVAHCGAMRRNGLRMNRPIFCAQSNNMMWAQARGTCTVSSGVLTHVSGDPFVLGANTDNLYRITIDGTEYWIDRGETMDGTHLTLTNVSVNEGGAVVFVINEGALTVAQRCYALSEQTVVSSRADEGNITWMGAYSQSPYIYDLYNVRRYGLKEGADDADAEWDDDAPVTGITHKEYFELAVALGSLVPFYTHQIVEGAGEGHAEPELWADAFAWLKTQVDAGLAVVWNMDDLYAALGAPTADLGPDYLVGVEDAWRA